MLLYRTKWIAGLVIGSFCTLAGSAAAADLSVVVDNVKPAVGSVVVAVYGNAADFPVPEKRLAVKVIEASGDKIEAEFTDLPAGRYAVAAYQDENGNGKLDKSFFGTPTEPYGFSNDARGTMGPPPFDDAAVTLEVKTTATIHLH